MPTPSKSSMEAMVQAFNALPRAATPPALTGANHWHFSIRFFDDTLDLRYVVFLISPGNTLQHVAAAGRGTQILPPATEASKEKIALVVYLLLEAFVGGVFSGLAPEHPLFAPWTWSCNDAVVGKAVEERLKELGVRQELCTVEAGSTGDNSVSDQQWSETIGVRENQESLEEFMS